MLHDEEKKYLLDVAHYALRDEIGAQHIAEVPHTLSSEALQQQAGVFVTLYNKKKLRGCLGLLTSEKSIVENVETMTRRAATTDTRFSPVSAGEADDIVIEISVLSPFQKISSAEEIVVGTHGLFIRQGMHSGLLLPQVAVEYGWNVQEFLEETCYKAGLEHDAWKNPSTEKYIYSAEIISEKVR